VEKPPRPPEDAETVFRKLEKRLEEAKSVSAKFRLTIEAEAGTVSVQGGIRWKPGDRFDIRTDAEGSKDGETRSRTIRLTSDGKTLRSGEEKGRAPKGYGRLLAASMVRSGFFPVASGQLQFFPTKLSDDPTTPDEAIRVGGFAFGASEKVGGKECTVLEFDMEIERFVEPAARVRLLLDPKTLLPVRLSYGSKGSKILVTFEEVSLDEIPDREFEVK